MSSNLWMGPYESVNLFGLLIQAVFIENFLLANFLGMCTYLACSTKLKTANGLGVAVVFILTVSGILNWFVHGFLTGPSALSWLSTFGIDADQINLGFLEFLLFISLLLPSPKSLKLSSKRSRLLSIDLSVFIYPSLRSTAPF